MKVLLPVLLVAAVFASAIGVVVAQHDARRLFVEIQDAERERDALIEEWGRLQLEQSTWSTDDRIEAMARTDLGMREPNTASLVLVKY